MKLVGGVDGDETGLIAGLLLRLILAPMEEKQKLHRLRRRNWRRNEGTQAMAKARWGRNSWGAVVGQERKDEGKTAAAESVERDDGRDGTAGGRD
ncbi:hypothetical protein H0E87_024691 [Populus deltoides]|uniref:Uncharacterized protein n=1 Tax=Populus deltoides TaxID=3696 RepID=A0A8T2XAH0_POPDE|nr:hypothetical protein H0E87_024691 [Populus deltoides]